MGTLILAILSSMQLTHGYHIEFCYLGFSHIYHSQQIVKRLCFQLCLSAILFMGKGSPCDYIWICSNLFTRDPWPPTALAPPPPALLLRAVYVCVLIVVDDVVSVFIHKADGDALATLVDNNVNVTMNISVGEVLTTLTFNENGTSSNHLRLSNLTAVKNINLLVMSLSFVVLLIIGLVCLLVYAVRRSKYLQAKNRARDMVSDINWFWNFFYHKTMIVNSH